ncbi:MULTISPECIES: hypothetical protein [Vibrio harveyi group]|nr:MULTISPECIES: hypothetical protein [Vibrio harveyi group]MCS0242658.1 hypothetical protein [Vibrio alginolyticus]HCM0816040.1 hypothetical protein [Vibrio parahaemolyticus]
MTEEKSVGILNRYWKAYGGFPAIFRSVFFYVAILLSAILYPAWSQEGWWDTVLSVMPNLLGFTLGGFAMWVAIGDENFKATIAGTSSSDEPSPFMAVNATFAHFIFLQILSILLALVNKAYNITLSNDHILVVIWGSYINQATLWFYYFSYFVFIYALLSSLASVIALFRVSYWYDDYQSKGIGDKIRKFVEHEKRIEELEKRRDAAKQQLQGNSRRDLNS